MSKKDDVIREWEELLTHKENEENTTSEEQDEKLHKYSQEEIPTFDKEDIFRKKMMPLIAQLYEIAVAEEIPFFSTVVFASNPDEGDRHASTMVQHGRSHGVPLYTLKEIIEGKLRGVPSKFVDLLSKKLLKEILKS